MAIKTITKTFGILLLIISYIIGHSQTVTPKKLKDIEGLEFVNGFAKLKQYTPKTKEPQPILVDTLGYMYPMAISIEALKPHILALDLSNQELANIPDIVFNNQQLKILFLNDNLLSEMPERISALGQLIHLDISWNPITALPETIGRLTALRNLNLTWTGIKQIPSSLNQLKQLETITVDNFSMSSDDISRLKETFPIEEISLEVSINCPSPKDTNAYNDWMANDLPKAFLSLRRSAYTYGREGDWYKLSWIALLVGEYHESINASLKIRPAIDSPYLNHAMDSRLALAYVLNNEWDKAIAVFDSWEKRIKPPFMEVKEWCITTVFEDIALLEAATITHPDFEKVEILLSSNLEAPVFEDVRLIDSDKY